MTVRNIGLNAYANAVKQFNAAEAKTKAAFGQEKKDAGADKGFASVFADSLSKVNALQNEKASMITSFASGENQNVHELMISLQKAGVAMQLTSAVRNKVLDAYRELSRMQF